MANNENNKIYDNVYNFVNNKFAKFTVGFFLKSFKIHYFSYVMLIFLLSLPICIVRQVFE